MKLSCFGVGFCLEIIEYVEKHRLRSYPRRDMLTGKPPKIDTYTNTSKVIGDFRLKGLGTLSAFARLCLSTETIVVSDVSKGIIGMSYSLAL